MMTFGVQFAESFPTTLRYYCSLHRYETSPNCLIEWIERIEWVSEWVNEWASEQASDRTNEQTKERTNERMLFVWQCEHLSDMWLSTLEIGSAQLRCVIEIAPKSPFLCENRSPIRYGRTDGRTEERMLFVWQCEHLSDMWLFTVELGTAQLRSITEITVLMGEEKAYPVWFSCRRKSYLAY